MTNYKTVNTEQYQKQVRYQRDRGLLLVKLAYGQIKSVTLRQKKKPEMISRACKLRVFENAIQQYANTAHLRALLLYYT